MISLPVHSRRQTHDHAANILLVRESLDHLHREIAIDAGASFRLGVFVRENTLGIGESARADDERLSASLEGFRHSLDRGAVGCCGLDTTSITNAEKVVCSIKAPC